MTVHRGIDATDRADLTPRAQWAELVEARRDYCRSAIIGDCRLIVQFASDAEAVGWLGFASKDEYLRDGLGLDPQVVEWALAGLRTVGVDAPRALKATAETGRKLQTRGAPTGNRNASKEVSNNKLDNINFVNPGGTSRDYLVSRLERDRPELAKEVLAGKKSAHAAAIEAGFRKKPTALDRLRSAWKIATKTERAKFLAEVG